VGSLTGQSPPELGTNLSGQEGNSSARPHFVVALGRSTLQATSFPFGATWPTSRPTSSQMRSPVPRARVSRARSRRFPPAPTTSSRRTSSALLRVLGFSARKNMAGEDQGKQVPGAVCVGDLTLRAGRSNLAGCLRPTMAGRASRRPLEERRTWPARYD